MTPPDDQIFHLATPAQWSIATATGEVAPPNLATEGFVHCSTEAQVASTIERHFAGHDELVLLRIDTDQVTTDLRWEESRPGELFPHVYRAIRVDEVVEVIPWRRAANDPA